MKNVPLMAVLIIIAGILVMASGLIQPVSAQGGAGTGAATDDGSASSASGSDFFEGESESASSSGKNSGSAHGNILICGGTIVIDGVCTYATR
jgi:hypothetical protein